MDAPLILSKTDEIKRIILLAMNACGVSEERAEEQVRVISPMLESVLVGDAPPGVSQWRLAGVKWNYWRYFEEEMQKKFYELITDVKQEYISTVVTGRRGIVEVLAELRGRIKKINV